MKTAELPALDRKWFFRAAVDTIPKPPVESVAEWGRMFCKLPGSARSSAFNPDITPWTVPFINLANDPAIRRGTYVKPVQSGGSVAGEIILNYMVATSTGGDIQYNWEDDQKAGERWDKRIERILKACPEVLRYWPEQKSYKVKKGLVNFPHLNLIVQGVESDSNLDSDSIRVQINEEIHNWAEGKLDKAYKRTTAFWDSLIINISNAGYVGDQLHRAFLAGTQQYWSVKCPGCGRYHVMHTKAEKDKPGGLRYDSAKCKRENGEYDYERMKGTIFYEFDCCSYRVYDSPQERRSLSLSGKFTEPQNPAPDLSEVSMTYDAVAVDYISWLGLIKEKHSALKVLRHGDSEPWKRYLQERECKFYDPEDRPLVGPMIYISTHRKSREGLKDRAVRLFAADRQMGSSAKGELPHWWLVIRDFMANGDSLLVYEGRIETANNLIDELKAHECRMQCGVIDSGWDARNIYDLCYKYDINAVKGEETKNGYAHPGKKGRLPYSEEVGLHTMIPCPPKYPYQRVSEWNRETNQVTLRSAPHPDEPLFFRYQKHLAWGLLMDLRRSSVKWEVPGDVSEDYKRHIEGVREGGKELSDGHEVATLQAVSKRIDLFVCESYIAMQAHQAGLIGGGDFEESNNKP